MPRKVRIDRVVNLADDGTGTFIVLEMNPSWKNLPQHEYIRSKKSTDTHTRIFRSRKKKKLDAGLSDYQHRALCM